MNEIRKLISIFKI